MSLVDKHYRRIATGIAAAALCVAGVQAAYAQSVVVRATGPSSGSYPAGKRIAANAEVTLKSGDMITVLDKSGTRVLKGPGTYKLDGAINRDNAGASTRVASLMSSGSNVRARTGAVRGAGTGAAVPAEVGPGNIWQIDSRLGGTWCVADPARLVIWRPDRTETVVATISGQSQTAEMEFRRGGALKLWPETVPVIDAATYTFALPGEQPTTIITRVLPGVPVDDMPAVAGMLADAGCTAQLDMLARAAARDAESEEAAAEQASGEEAAE